MPNRELDLAEITGVLNFPSLDHHLSHDYSFMVGGRT
jgi:hypothetical protein